VGEGHVLLFIGYGGYQQAIATTDLAALQLGCLSCVSVIRVRAARDVVGMSWSRPSNIQGSASTEVSDGACWQAREVIRCCHHDKASQMCAPSPLVATVPECRKVLGQLGTVASVHAVGNESTFK
jgi:hypothetical protein